LGVDAVVGWAAGRSVARWRDGRPLARWRATAREATKQSRRRWLPEIAGPVTTAQVGDRLSVAAAGYVLHEEATEPLTAVDLPGAGAVVLVVGPEGGIAEEELAVFVAAGAVPIHLGEPVLRTSTAGAAGLAALSVRLGRW